MKSKSFRTRRSLLTLALVSKPQQRLGGSELLSDDR